MKTRSVVGFPESTFFSFFMNTVSDFSRVKPDNIDFFLPSLRTTSISSRDIFSSFFLALSRLWFELQFACIVTHMYSMDFQVLSPAILFQIIEISDKRRYFFF